MQLNFKQVGEQGKPVIILHGVFGLLDNWSAIGKTIAELGFRVFLIDQRHHGRSPQTGPLNFTTFASDLKEFIAEHQLEEPILIGHSMGGKTVMQYAVTYPNTFGAIVVVDIGPKAYPIHHAKILEGLNAIPIDKIESRNDADEVLSKYEPILPVRQFLLKNLYRKDEGGFAWRFNLPLLTTDMANVGEEIKYQTPVEGPVLFIRGAESNYIKDPDFAGIQEMFPEAKLETIAGTGHWVQAEKPREFVAVLMEFLDNAT